MYAGPVIDAHHHLWDLSMDRHRWLSPGGSAGPLAALAPVAETYRVDDYRRDAAGQNVVATVHVEALWSGDPAEETRWLDTLDKGDGVALRYVANARLGTPAAARLVEAAAVNPRVVGVREVLSHHPDPAKSLAADPDLAARPGWRRDLRRVRDRGLHLELLMNPRQAGAVVDLARAFPDLLIVVDHGGSPIDRDADGMARWRDALRRLGAEPNVALKLSHPGAYDPGWTPASLRDAVRFGLDRFGPARAMFGTDAPVSRLVGTLAEVCAAMRAAVADLSFGEQRALFFGNARRVYGLDEVADPFTAGASPAP